MRRVALFGATGFIGPHLIRRLQDQGAGITVLARPTSSTAAIEPLGVTIVRGDVRDDESVRQTVAGADTVIYAAVARGREAVTHRQNRVVNVEGLERVLRASVELGISRFVHCSSGGVVGLQPNRPVSEDHQPAPDTDYRRTKVEAERLVRSYRDRLPVVTARLSSVYGPGSRKLAGLARDVQRGRVTGIGSGHHFHHLTHVDDITHGLVLCATHPAAPGRTFHLAADPIPTLRECYDAIAKALGVRYHWRALPAPWLAARAARALNALTGLAGWEPRRLEQVKFFSWPRAYDTSRARTELGFRPSVKLEDGIGAVMQWYRANDLLG